MIEFVIKNIALSPKVYIQNKLNLLDTIIIGFIIFEYGMFFLN